MPGAVASSLANAPAMADEGGDSTHTLAERAAACPTHTWTANVGGGDVLVYYDANGRFVPRGRGLLSHAHPARASSSERTPEMRLTA